MTYDVLVVGNKFLVRYGESDSIQILTGFLVVYVRKKITGKIGELVPNTRLLSQVILSQLSG